MRLIVNKHLNHGENSEQLGTKSRLSTRKRQASTKKYFNQKMKMVYGSSYIVYLVPIESIESGLKNLTWKA